MEPVVVANNRSSGSGEDAAAVADQTTAPSAVAGEGNGSYDPPNQWTGLTMKEKKLEPKVWMYQGQNHKGSHFPLVAYTDNVGRRSADRLEARAKKRWVRPYWGWPQ